MGVNCKRSTPATVEAAEQWWEGILLHQRLPVVRLIENKFAEGVDLWQGHSPSRGGGGGEEKVRVHTTGVPPPGAYVERRQKNLNEKKIKNSVRR